MIPEKEGLAHALQGNAFTEVDSPHYNFHESLEKFWDQFRRRGPRKGGRPRSHEYDTALREALRAAGVDAATIDILADAARRQRIDHGIGDQDFVPRVPRKLGQKKRNP